MAGIHTGTVHEESGRSAQPAAAPESTIHTPQVSGAPDHLLAARIAAGANPTAALSRVSRANPFLARRSLVALQRVCGNRSLQRAFGVGIGGNEVEPEVESAIHRARGGGQALDSGVRGKMESAFGADFGGVRVHTGSESDSLNRSVNAVAFTTGQDIFFSNGSYDPTSSSGKELLTHELTHVVQQGGSPVQGKLVLNEPGDVYEKEADAAAAAVSRMPDHGLDQKPQPTSPGGKIRRKCACGGSGPGECAECAAKRKAKREPEPARTAAIAGNDGEMHPLTRALIEDRFAGRVERAVVHSRDESGTRTATLAMGGPPARQASAGKHGEEAASDQGGMQLTADVRIERPVYPATRMATLTDQGEVSADDADQDSVVRLGQSDDDLDGGTTDGGTMDGGTTDGGSTDGGTTDSGTTTDGGDVTRQASAGTCAFTVTYANVRNTGCGAGRCGAQIVYDITGACGTGTGCPNIDGLRLTESVTTDNGCGPGTVQTGAGCPISSTPPFLPTCGRISNCTDTYGLCGPPAYFPAAGCTENYTQKLFIGGTLAETHTITFKITRTGGGCSGTVTRS
jgi:hypothetical protein